MRRLTLVALISLVSAPEAPTSQLLDRNSVAHEQRTNAPRPQAVACDRLCRKR